MYSIHGHSKPNLSNTQFNILLRKDKIWISYFYPIKKMYT